MASIGGDVAEDDWNDSGLGMQFCKIDWAALGLKLTLPRPSGYAEVKIEKRGEPSML